MTSLNSAPIHKLMAFQSDPIKGKGKDYHHFGGDPIKGKDYHHFGSDPIKGKDYHHFGGARASESTSPASVASASPTSVASASPNDESPFVNSPSADFPYQPLFSSPSPQ